MKKKNKLKPNVMVTGAVAAVLLVIILLAPDTWKNLITKMLIMAIFAMSVNIQMGHSGMFPLGCALFFGSGSYIFAMLVENLGWGIVAAAATAILANLILIAAIGFLCLRANSDLSFALLSLGFCTLAFTIVGKIRALGTNVGIACAAKPLFANTPRSFGIFVLAVTAVCMAVIYVISKSPFMAIAHGLRENSTRLAFVGVNITGFKFSVFILGNFFAGIAGVLYTMLNSGAFPNYFNLSMQGIMMCLLGGMSTFAGPVVGAFIITFIITVVSNETVYWQGILGILIVVCVLFLRGGLINAEMGRRIKALFKKKGDA